MCFYFQALLKSITVVFLNHSSEGGFRGVVLVARANDTLQVSLASCTCDSRARLEMTDNPILACLLARDLSLCNGSEV